MYRQLVVRLVALVATVTLPLVGVAAPTAVGADNPYERGPAPTASSVLGNGSYSVSTTSVSRLAATGFGGGTIYYPSTTSDGTFGGVVLAPGFTATSSAYAGLARRVASHGFVVFAIDTSSTLDQPDSRGRQILTALDYLTQRSSVRARVDTSRLAVSGHSMGGGGTLAAANSRSSLKAAVALQPWHTTKRWSGISVPTMIIGAQNDSIAANSSHSIPFYTSLTGASERAYGELRGESHLAANTNPDWQGRLMVTWLKRYVDSDLRYSQFLCPAPTSTALSDYRNSCPD
ncbi:alpha/beta hydrolase family protein [Mumia zhuanghuii]|uniref:Phosphohydrolase n=1 Tax=Mumia zhuanghuii TaxID=2585211 RepID=A0A5C4MFP4_9ACTN|nr:alpha/beta hydrolase [Mumia zhuanghuii]TNC37215.1 phosphohydrolase [Mumia zhuanghuii]TNC43114.1 phosphohydrolase [Mumia zhuanghuii]